MLGNEKGKLDPKVMVAGNAGCTPAGGHAGGVCDPKPAAARAASSTRLEGAGAEAKGLASAACTTSGGGAASAGVVAPMVTSLAAVGGPGAKGFRGNGEPNCMAGGATDAD